MEIILVTIIRWLLSLAFSGFILGSLFFLFWTLNLSSLKKYRITPPPGVKPIFKKEIARSIFGLSLYMFPTTFLYFTDKYFGYTPMYTDINKYGISYVIFTVLLFIFVIDAWFYWAHRLMHAHPFFIKAHNIHHESYDTNPWSAYSVDIIHGALNVIPYAVIILFIPWHPSAVAAFGLFSVFYNGYIHLGYDFPLNFIKDKKVFKYINTATHHAIHHHELNYNYSAYFTFWDKLMKTEKLPELSKSEQSV